MRCVFLLAILLLPALATPLSWLPVHAPLAHAQPPKTQAGQIHAIDLWAGVIRRGKTAKVMYQVADLLAEVCDTINADPSMLMQFDFKAALYQMKSAAGHKAHGLDTGYAIELDVAEQLVSGAQRRVRGKR